MEAIRKTGHLLTEAINQNTINIDELETADIVALINGEERAVIKAVANQKENIAKAVDTVFEALSNNGKLFFVGAGTSGRLGVLEAVECPPTFGSDPATIQAIIAGGKEAVWHSIEGAEDSETESIEELKSRGLKSGDVLIGITASSSTPFVQSALIYSKKRNVKTVLITCNKMGKMVADTTIELLVGPEVIVGSTRLKAGTATKMALNIITTAAMVKWGKTLGNLMVDIQPKSLKLKDRAIRIVMHICGLKREEAHNLLVAVNWNVKVAILMNKKALNLNDSQKLLEKSKGILKEALKWTG